MTHTNAMQFTPIPGAERLVGLHAAELPQKDELCGAFWGTLAFRLAGITLHGAEVDQDAIGLEAGAILSAGEPEPLPYGDPGRRDYRAAFPTVEDSALSGTSAVGLVHALRELAGDSAAIIPIAGPWTPAAVRALLDATEVRQEPCTLIANLATRHLWGSRPGPAAAFAYLATRRSTASAPNQTGTSATSSVCSAGSTAPGDARRRRRHLPRARLAGIPPPADRAVGAWRSIGPGPAGPRGRSSSPPRTTAPKSSGVLLAAGLELDVWDNGTPDRVGNAA